MMGRPLPHPENCRPENNIYIFFKIKTLHFIIPTSIIPHGIAHHDMIPCEIMMPSLNSTVSHQEYDKMHQLWINSNPDWRIVFVNGVVAPPPSPTGSRSFCTTENMKKQEGKETGNEHEFVFRVFVFVCVVGNVRTP